MSEETKVETQEQESSFDINSLNEALGEGFTFEDTGSLKETLTRYNELNSQSEAWGQEKTEWETKYNDLDSKYNNAMSYFSDGDLIEKLYGSRDTWERVQLEKKFADKDIDAVNKIYKSDLNTLGDIDAILLADKLKYKANISDSDRKSAILKRMGIEDGELTDLDASQKYSLSVATAEAKEMLNEVKSFTPEDLKFDWLEEAKTNLTSREEKLKSINEGWTKAATDALTAYEGTKAFSKNGEQVEEIFSYDADQKFKEEVLPVIIKDFTSQGLDPSEESNLKLLSDYIDQQHKVYAFDKMIKKAAESAKTKAEDAAHEEIHSDKKQNTTEAPPVKTDTAMSLHEYRMSKNK